MAKSSGRNRYLRRSGAGGAGPAGAAGGQQAFAQAQEMLAKAQDELATTTVEGSAGGGAVRVTMNGQQRVTAVEIEPDVIDPDDAEMLQDLILAAIHDASDRAKELQESSLGALTGGLNLPGLGLG